MKNRRLIALLLCICTLLTLIAGAFTVRAEDDPNASKVVLDKTVADNGDGTFTLTLDSYVTGTKTTVEEVVRIPADIVLVLDESGSMDNCIICGKEIKNYNAEQLAGYEKVYTLDPAKASSYFYRLSEDDPEYYSATYCDKTGCSGYGKWFQRNNNHKPGEAHDSGNERAPKTSVTDTNGYQYYEFSHAHSNRYDALKDAVNTFLQSVYTESKGKDGVYNTADDVQHRVAIIGFGDKGHLRTYVNNANANTGAFGDTWKGKTTDTTALTSADNPEDYDGLNGYLHRDDWKNSDGTLNTDRSRYYRLLRWATQQSDRNALSSALGAIGLDNGSTYTELGLDAARALFAFTNNPYKGNKNISADTTSRNRVVVMFTDGAPTHGSAYFSNANDAISYANDLKNNYNASVYTVGIFSGADSSNPGTLPTFHGISNSYYPDSSNAANSAKGIDLANRFMHLVSSNYINATAMDSTGSLNGSGGYYMSASNADELKSVFQKISNDITSDQEVIKLTDKAVVTDFVTDYFDVIEGNVHVKAHSETFAGYDADNKPTWTITADDKEYIPKVDGRKVTVDGFNFQENYVGIDIYKDEDNNETRTPHGRKLVLEIDIKPRVDFLGGDEVVTNTDQSGIYNNGALVAEFPVPNVDVPVKEITPVFKDDAIYISQQAAIPHVANIGKFSVNGTTYTIDGTNNAYVDIVYTISDQDNNQISYTVPAGTPESGLKHLQTGSWTGSGIDIYKALTDDTQYSIKCEVISINNRGGNNSDASGNATIFVYKPHVTFKDSIMNYGDTADYDQNNFVSVVWKNNDKTAGADGNSHNAILGDAPQLQFNFNPPEDVCTIETPVNVTSVISPTNTHTNHRVPENTEIITHTTFHREACTICGYSGKVCGEQCVKIEEGTPNFIVHLNSFDLVITKVVNGKIDDGQSFLFNVNGPGFSGDVVISKFTYDEDNKKTTGSVTVKSLTAGEYTIEELIDWSWRYKIADGSSLTQTITSANGNTSVTFTNEREDIYWLSGDSIAKNWWGDGLVERTETAIIEALSSGN